MRLIDGKFLNGSSSVTISERRRLKRVILYRWLHEYRYVDRTIIRLLLGISDRAAYSFVKELKVKGKLKSETLAVSYSAGARAEGIYYMTHDGFDEWLAIDHELSYGDYHFESRAKNLGSSLVSHNIRAQYGCLDLIRRFAKKTLDSFDVYSEKNTHNGLKIGDGKLGREPDCLLVVRPENKGEILHCALEMELVQKNTKRIYWAFRQHANALIDGYYDRVFYYFDNDRLRSYYFDLFSEESWPHIEMVRGQYNEQDNTERFVLSDYAEITNSFHFLTLDESISENVIKGA